MRQQQSPPASASASGKGKAATGPSASTETEDPSTTQLNYRDLARIFQHPDDLEVSEGKDPLACMTPSDPAEIRRVQQYVAVQCLINPKISDAEIQLGFYAMEIDLYAGQAASKRYYSYRGRTTKARDEG